MAEVKKTAKKPAVSATQKVSGKPAASKKPAEQNTEEFAVIETGGKQYKVSAGDDVKIEKLVGEFKEGDKITFDKVLLVDNGKDTTIGTPYIEEAKVLGTLKEMGRNKKISVIRFKAKSRYFKKKGHRQPFFKVHIDTLK